MWRQIKQVIAIASLTIAVLGTGIFVIQAQQGKSNGAHSVDWQKAKDEVSKSRVASSFTESLSRDDSGWKLAKAYTLEIGKQMSDWGTTSLLFQKGNKSLGVELTEYESESKAVARVRPLMSYGSVVPFNDYGDSGDKILGDRGDLVAIRFRKGRFFVEIFHSDMKTSRIFADQELKAIDAVK